MWLPAPIYERMPVFWVVLGCLFIAYGFYLGLHISGALIAAIAGIGCCLYGAGVRVVRVRYRRGIDRSELTSELISE